MASLRLQAGLGPLFGIILGAMTACAPATDTAGTDTSASLPTTTDIRTATDASDDGRGRAEEAVARANQFFAAVNEGRVDDLAEIMGAELNEADRKSYEFHRILIGNGYPWEVESCEAVDVGPATVFVECNMTNTDPVFTAEGASEVIAPFMFGGGVLLERGWVPKGESFSTPLGSYVSYLRAFHGDDYDQYCAPPAQTGPIRSHAGIARVPECGLVLSAHTNDVAAWVEAGKPTTQP